MVCYFTNKATTTTTTEAIIHYWRRGYKCRWWTFRVTNPTYTTLMSDLTVVLSCLNFIKIITHASIIIFLILIILCLIVTYYQLPILCFTLYITFVTSPSLLYHDILSTPNILFYTESYIILITSPDKLNFDLAKTPEIIPVWGCYQNLNSNIIIGNLLNNIGLIR